MTNQNKFVLFITVALIVIAIWYLESTRAHVGSPSVDAVSIVATSTDTVSSSPVSANDITAIRAQKAKQYPPAVEIMDPTGFINTPNGSPIKIADYIGKDIILIDFMTYSCINCQRTFPYTTAWYGKYKDQGFIIIGIHTPEFDFEKDYNNVSQAMKRFDITYPVVMDSNYGTWTAYHNQYWPRDYLIDIDGYIVEDHAGEGGYQNTEQKIKDLIKERDQRLGLPIPIDVTDNSFVNPTGAVVSIQTNSPETYFGSNRNEYLANGKAGQAGLQTFTLSGDPDLQSASNYLYLSGIWNIVGEYAESQSANSGFIYNYEAKNVYFVASADQTVIAEVTLDSKPISANIRGSDVYESGGKTYVKIDESRLYSIVAGSAMEAHTLQITGQTAGLKAFTLTFG